jgi:23S rRNA pseudouridine2605 synthase
VAEGVRIAKALADGGVASRRKAELLVQEGRVALNGEVVGDLGRRVAPDDVLTVDGRPVHRAVEEDHVTIAMHKPQGVVVSRGDPQHRTTVYDILPPRLKPVAKRLRYAGRLDVMTSGLLILSTDGALIHRLTHPSRHVPRTYVVAARTELDEAAMERFRRGMRLDGGEAVQPAQIEALDPTPAGRPRYRLVLQEGRNRQVRRMFEAVDNAVAELSRVGIGRLGLEELKLGVGKCRVLGPGEIARLMDGGRDDD